MASLIVERRLLEIFTLPIKLTFLKHQIHFSKFNILRCIFKELIYRTQYSQTRILKFHIINNTEIIFFDMDIDLI